MELRERLADVRFVLSQQDPELLRHASLGRPPLPEIPLHRAGTTSTSRQLARTAPDSRAAGRAMPSLGPMGIPGFRGVSIRAFGQQLWKELQQDAVTDAAAQLSYYLLFALFPFLFFLVTLTAYLPLGGAANELLSRLSAVMPPDALRIISDQLHSLLNRPKPHLLTAGLVISLYSASRGADAFRKLLNIAYDVHEGRPFWKTTLLAFGFTILGAVLTLVGLTMIVLGEQVGLRGAEKLGLGAQYLVAWTWLRWPATALVIMFVAAVGYYLLPDVEQKFRYITPGSVAATALWLLGTWGFTQYVDHFNRYNVTYGSLGGVVILLTWLYISGLVFMLGGEVNAVIEHLSAEGKARGAKRFGEAPAPLHERPSAAPPGAAKDAHVAAEVHERNQRELQDGRGLSRLWKRFSRRPAPGDAHDPRH